MHRKRIIVGSVILLTLLGAGMLVTEILRSQNRFGLPPYAREGIKIENVAVYRNGTVHFTARCYFISYGLPRPTGDQYQIQFVYLWSIRNHGYLMEFTINDNGSLAFNQTLGDIQKASEVTVNGGDLNLAIDEELSIRLQTPYPLNTSSSIYVGVMAFGHDYRRVTKS
ncbi:MAG: hypothetical protein ACW98F_18235 [Candidatus Hodarchaeales archaeon]